MKSKHKRLLIILGIVSLIAIIYSLTYIPKKVISIDSTKVAEIVILDGSTGREVVFTDKADIEYIINDLNEVTFKKKNLSIGYMGFSFRAQFYNDQGKKLNELIISSEDKIRYRAFFWEARENTIDFDFIAKAFE